MQAARPRSSPDTVAAVDLALSGGGFRAALFHLGVVAYLRRQHLLEKIRIICSVSGGSIAAAHLVAHFNDYRGTEEQFRDRVCQLVDGIMTRDISGSVLAESSDRVRDLRPLDSELLAKAYHGLLGFGPTVEDRWDKLPAADRPELYVLATHLNTGQPGAYHRTGFDMMPVPENHMHAAEILAIQALAKAREMQHLPISRAVAASSAFPPAFSPLRLVPGDSTHAVTDGGVYDNSGVRYLEFLYEDERFERGATDRLVVISDAGRDFPTELGELYDSFFPLAFRVTDAQGNRIAEFDSDAAIAEDGILRSRGAVIMSVSIHDKVDLLDQEPKQLTSHSRLLETRLRRIRTELDRFSREEVFVLFRQGYLLARQQYGELFDDDEPAGDIPWTPVDSRDEKDGQINLRSVKVDDLETAIANSHAFTKAAELRKMLPGIIVTQVWRAYRRRILVALVVFGLAVGGLGWFWFSSPPDVPPTGTLAIARVDPDAHLQPWVWQANALMALIPDQHAAHAFISVPLGALTRGRRHAPVAFAPVAIPDGRVFWFLDEGNEAEPRLVALAQISVTDTRLRVPPGGPNDTIRGILVVRNGLADPKSELARMIVIKLEGL